MHTSLKRPVVMPVDEATRRLYGDRPVKVLAEFAVMHTGWEMDNLGWIIETEDGQRHYVTTNHGRSVIEPADELRKTLAEHARTTEGLWKAVALLNPTTETAEKTVI